MKYGRSDIRRNLRNFTSERIEQKAGMTLVRLFLIGTVALLVAGCFFTFGIVQGLLETAPDITNITTAPVSAATYIYDAEGNQVQKLTAATSNRIPVSIDQIPQSLQDAIVAIEDERFFEHKGIDIRGIIRAFVVGVRNQNFSEGASTITQQLLKNSVFTDWTSESSLVESFKRKFQEQYLAIRLEQNLEASMGREQAKLQILEDYLNTINLGAGTYGVQAAAQRYFYKDVSELTLSEAAVIAGITQNPTGYNPILYPKANAKRRKQVLKSMLRQNYITKSQYKEALNDNVYERIQEISVITDESENVYSYYTDALIDQVLDDLVAAGYSRTQASNALYSGGLRIYSAQDPDIQKICDEEFNNPDNYPAETLIGLDYALSIVNKKGNTIHYSSQDLLEYFQKEDPNFSLMFPDEETARSYAKKFRAAKVKKSTTVLGERISLIPQPQASVVVLDQETGLVKAIVGGRGEKEASLTLNRASSTRRQPGSTFKPLAVYGPALEQGKITLASVYENAPYQYSSGHSLTNWDAASGYDGYETIHTAITRSTNVVAVKVMEEVTPQTGLDTLEALGITTLYNGDVDPDGNVLTDAYESLALGGVTDGVVNLELTAAYAALANGGTYIAPKFYTRVEDRNGNIILNNSSEKKRVFSKQTAFLLTSAMKSVISDPAGTAYEYIDLGEMAAAGKSGTTDSSKDIWFEGYTPYYTCGIWGGYDNNQPLPDTDRSYSSYAKVLWNSIMNRIHEDLAAKDFDQPDKIVSAQICSKSGKLAVPGLCDCDPRGSCVVTEYFEKGTKPKKSCTVHTTVEICSETGLVAGNSCTNTYSYVALNLPDDSSTETDDSQYRIPQEKCPGHVTKNTSSSKENTKKQTEAQNEIEIPESSIIVDGQVIDPNSYYGGNNDTSYDFNSIPADSYYNNGINIY